MSILEQIITKGNRPPLRVPYDEAKRGPNKIRCVDGFTVSVIAGDSTYCTPRPSDYGIGDVPADYSGPYAAVEVGFPSERPEPWDAWVERCDDPDEPTGTVYAYVPVEMVRALITLHGGEVQS